MIYDAPVNEQKSRSKVIFIKSAFGAGISPYASDPSAKLLTNA